jgi:hypothetical protein
VTEIFNQVTQASFGYVPAISTICIGGSAFESSVLLLDDQKTVRGGIRQDEVSANVDVMIAVLNHVEKVCGKNIRDITYDLLASMRRRFDSFDEDSKFIVSQSLMLFVSTRRCHAVVSVLVDDVIAFADRGNLPGNLRAAMIDHRTKILNLFRQAQMLLSRFDSMVRYFLILYICCLVGSIFFSVAVASFYKLFSYGFYLAGDV